MIFANKNQETSAPSNGSTTFIGSGVVLTGDINSTADIRIDGTVKGNVLCSARVLIGTDGAVEGNVDCNQADVMGRIKGNIKAKEVLSLRGTANLIGDIFASKLQVEPTVNFNGRCNMGSPTITGSSSASTTTVVEMIKETAHELPKAVAR
jgi:cytoskeletal protein CcmA (bactofilin family)